jgi:hypothetical protein
MAENQLTGKTTFAHIWSSVRVVAYSAVTFE